MTRFALPIDLWPKYVWPLVHSCAYQWTKHKLCFTTGLKFFNSISYLLPCQICGHHLRESLTILKQQQHPKQRQEDKVVEKQKEEINWFDWTVWLRKKISNYHKLPERSEQYCRATSLGFQEDNLSQVKSWYRHAWNSLFLLGYAFPETKDPVVQESAQFFLKTLAFIFPGSNIRDWLEVCDTAQSQKLVWIQDSHDFLQVIYALRQERTWNELLGTCQALTVICANFFKLNHAWLTLQNKYSYFALKQQPQSVFLPPTQTISIDSLELTPATTTTTTTTTTTPTLPPGMDSTIESPTALVVTHPPRMQTMLHLQMDDDNDATPSTMEPKSSQYQQEQIIVSLGITTFLLLILCLSWWIMKSYEQHKAETLVSSSSSSSSSYRALISDISKSHEVFPSHSSL